MKKKALVINFNSSMEYNISLVYKSIYLAEISDVIKKKNWEVKVIDILFNKTTISDLIKLFLSKPNVIFFYTDVHQSHKIKELALLSKKLSSKTKIMVYGRATSMIPQFFTRQPFDAVHTYGDREVAISNYINYLENNNEEELAGITIVYNDDSYKKSYKECLIADNQWPFPDLDAIPIEQYLLYNKIKKPNKKLVLGISTSKGCPYQCKYCGASMEEGKFDRRRDSKEIIDWAINKKCYLENIILQFWSPNILSDLNWLKIFHKQYKELNADFYWRGVSRLNNINENTLKLLKETNCDEIATGIETIKKETNKPLKSTIKTLTRAVTLFKKYNIKLKGLLMIGYPGQTLEDIEYTYQILDELDIEYRTTAYTPFEDLSQLSGEKLDNINLELYDRRSFDRSDMLKISSSLFYDLLVNNGRINYNVE